MVASGVQTQEHTDLDPQQFDNPRMISGLMVIELTADAKIYRQNSCCNKFFSVQHFYYEKSAAQVL